MSIKIKQIYTDQYSDSEQLSDINKFNSFKHDSELFDEEKYVVYPIIEIKRFDTRKLEKWEIKENNKISFTIRSDQLTEKEKKYLRSASGMNLLLELYKTGVRTVSRIKTKIKEKL